MYRGQTQHRISISRELPEIGATDVEIAGVSVAAVVAVVDEAAEDADVHGLRVYSGHLASPGLSYLICTVMYYETFACIRRPGLGWCSICIMMTILVDVFSSVFQ